MDVAWRIAVAAGAVVLASLVVTLDIPVPVAVALVAALLLAGGALANRPWVALVPFGAGAVYCFWIYLMEGSDVSDTGHDASWGMIISIVGFVAMIAAVGLGFGVAARWGIDAAAQRRRDGVRRAPGPLATRQTARGA
jgi:hypothetical protein